MRRNNIAAVLLASSFLGGCAGGRRSPAPTAPEILTAVDSIASEKLIAQRRDSAGTLDAHWRGLDSAQAPSQFAAKLYLLTLDNFLAVAPDDPRVAQVRLWKANQLYNDSDYDSAVGEYREILKRYPHSDFTAEANQMIAQSFDRQGQHAQAEDWYRRMLQDTNGSVRHQAQERIAQSIYLQAGAAEKAKNYPQAAKTYARVSQEFPQADIAPIALFNAGVMAERTEDWKGAIGYYNHFFDLYYKSDVLPRVLFREAKCREMNGEFKTAGEKYRNLAKTYPRSSQAEEAMYNAGFAFASAGMIEDAAQAFENYAMQYPNQPEAANLLSRAVEAYGSLKDWDKVADLESQFARRYGGDKSRLVQALSMGGLTAEQRGKEEDAKSLSQKALSEFAQLRSPDATARFYAAQAHQTLGDLAAARMRALPLRPSAIDNDLKAKRTALRAAVDEYLAAMQSKIVDGVVHAGFGMGRLFQDYGDQAFAALRKPDAAPAQRAAGETEALAERSTAYNRAAQQYGRVLIVAREQKLNNRNVEDTRGALRELMTNALAGLDGLDSALAAAYPFRTGTVEEALSLRLTQAQQAYQSYQQDMGWMAGIFQNAPEFGWDSLSADSLGGRILARVLAQGMMFQSVVDTAEAAPIPAGYDSVQTFFYLAKLEQDLLPSIAARAADIFASGIRFADSSRLDARPETHALQDTLGRSLFATARAFDLLADRALAHAPIPAGLPDAQRKTFQKKFEQIGYTLRDRGVQADRALVASAVQGLASPSWAARSFAALLRVEPDRWSSPGRDTVQAFQTGPGWKTCFAASEAKEVCPDSAWRSATGLMPHAPAGDIGSGWIRSSPLPKHAPMPAASIRFSALLPWSEDPDSVQLECAATGPVRVRVGNDSLPTFANYSHDVTKITLSPRAGNLPPIEWKSGTRITLRLPVSPTPDSTAVLFRLRVFGRVGAGQIAYPWNHQPAAEAVLDSLQNLPFVFPNFTWGASEKR